VDTPTAKSVFAAISKSGFALGNALLFIVIFRLFARCSLFDLFEQNFPTLCGLQPKCLIRGIDHMPRQFSAFFDLSLEENFFVEHGCVRRGRLPRDGLTEVWSSIPPLPRKFPLAGPANPQAELCARKGQSEGRAFFSFTVL